MITAHIITDAGSMSAELFYLDAPKTVDAFVRAADAGAFEEVRVEPPAPGAPAVVRKEGARAEPAPLEVRWGCQYQDRGVLAVGRSGAASDCSVLVISTSRAGSAPLEGFHTCFGRITSGEDVLRRLEEEGLTIESVVIDDRRPVRAEFNFGG